jgi:prephenate dehydrogenase
MADLSRHLAPHLKSGAIITDVGSVKAPVVESLEPIFAAAECHFVGSHPMAGAEKTGVANAREELFDQAICAVTPTSRTHPDALRTVEQFWTHLHSRVLRLSPAQHDELVARSSHLPHVVAAALASYVLSPAHALEQSTLCATGFRDTTRIASGSPEMWRDIALTNRTFLAKTLGVFIADLQEVQRSLNEGDTSGIEEFFNQAKRRRDAWLGASTPPSQGSQSST